MLDLTAHAFVHRIRTLVSTFGGDEGTDAGVVKRAATVRGAVTLRRLDLAQLGGRDARTGLSLHWS